MHEVYQCSRVDCEHGPFSDSNTSVETTEASRNRGLFSFIQQRGINSKDASQMHAMDTEFGEADILSTAKVVQTHV